MDNKDEIIAKLKRENAYLKSLLEQNGISYEEPKEIKQRICNYFNWQIYWRRIR